MKLKNLEYRSLWYKKIYYYLRAGQSLSDAASTAASDVDTRYISFELLEGVSLSRVCNEKDLSRCFSSAEKSLIAVAEKTGNMKEVCLSLSSLLKSRYMQRQKLIAATIYPGLILLMASGLLTMILIVIVPKIAPLFSSMKELPTATKILIELSNHIIGLWYVDLVSIISIFLIHLRLRKERLYNIFFKSLQLWACQRLPYIKDVYLLWYIERWTQIMHLSLSARVTLSEALLYAAESVDSLYLQKYFLLISDKVLQGYSCSESMNDLPAEIGNNLKDWISIIASGEKTGSLVDVFYVSHIHIHENLLESIDRFQKIIEPLLIICVGIMVLAICLSIILPMYQLTQSLQ